MSSVAMADIAILSIIFCVLIAISAILVVMRRMEAKGMGCPLCGGSEHFDVEPGDGPISGRMVVKCFDCKTIREVTDADLGREMM